MQYKICYAKYLFIFFLILFTFNYASATNNLPSLPNLDPIQNTNNSYNHVGFFDKIKSSFNSFLGIFKKETKLSKIPEIAAIDTKDSTEHEVDVSEIKIPSLSKINETDEIILPKIPILSQTINNNDEKLSEEHSVKDKLIQEVDLQQQEAPPINLPIIPQKSQNNIEIPIIAENISLEESSSDKIDSSKSEKINITENNNLIQTSTKELKENIDEDLKEETYKLSEKPESKEIDKNSQKNDEPVAVFVIPVQEKVEITKIQDVSSEPIKITTPNEQIKNSIKLDDTLEKFISNETQMLLLPNDDVVTGKITMEAQLELMNIQNYFSYIEKKQEKIKNKTKEDNINNYVKNYQKNFYILSKIKIVNLNDIFDEASNDIVINNIEDLRILLDNYKFLHQENSFNQLLKQSIQDNNYYMTKFLLKRRDHICILDYCNLKLIAIANKEVNQNIYYLMKKI